MDHETGDAACRRRRAERQPHHAAARRRRRRHRRYPQRLPAKPEFAVRHGTGRRCAVCGRHRRGAALSVQSRRTAHCRSRRQGGRSAGRADHHHWTKNILASRDGKRLYATVGSNSNVAEIGIENETNRAAILEIDLASGRSRVFASGLRNPNGLGWEPRTGMLWTAVNERDELGSDLVPDYMTSVKDGAFYGWPYSYYGQP